MTGQALPKERPDAVTKAYLGLRELIVRGTISPGTPLIERRMAEVVGVSRTTVRNALQRLSHEGFVTISGIGASYSRFFVGPLTINDMVEWYYLFGALDGIAARRASELPRERRRTLAQRVRGLATEHLEAGTGANPHFEKIQEKDALLHGTYVEAGGGPRLLQEYSLLRPHVERYGRFYATALIRELPLEVFHEHIAIAEALDAGDPDAAESAAVANWRNASERFARVMGEWGERGNW
ncbi:GntR family transcriptional regulator [Gemmatimonadota bacterium]